MFSLATHRFDYSFFAWHQEFHLGGYTFYRRDRNENGVVLLLYVRDDVPSTLLKIDPNFEAFYVELNIRKEKPLLFCLYNPNKSYY